jgi:hypothetical protein
MNGFDEQEFTDVIQRLGAERPRATALELDQIKMRAMTRASSPAGPAKGARMRRTVTVVLAAGSLIFGTSGVVLAGGGHGGGGGHNDGDHDDNSDDGQYGCQNGGHGKSCKPPKTNKSKAAKSGRKSGKRHGSHGSK